MSLEIEIPKEITKYEAKLMFGLTTRQCVCTAAAIGSAIATNWLCGIFAPNAATFAMIAVAIPFVLVGFVKRYGMPFEKYAIGYIKTTFLAPLKRKNKIKNQFALINTEMNTETDGKKVKYKKSKLAFK